ncbi:MAG: HAD hydrolase-like protein [Xanthomonadaceae bacterium]|nr:HAD hydrolase-like protein [Xanthomonadaceae bacterium]
MIPHETIKVAVLDFDGTLIDSNSLKYKAFFKLFPDGTTQDIVRAVLDEMFEASRFEILAEILARRDHCRPEDCHSEVQSQATAFNNIVVVGAKHCREIEGAAEALVFLSSRVRLYVSSTTPEDALKEIIAFRGWGDYFVDIFGHPRKKSETLAMIMAREQVESSMVMVVGDGESDRISASEKRCRFIPVHEAFPLFEVARMLGDNSTF